MSDYDLRHLKLKLCKHIRREARLNTKLDEVMSFIDENIITNGKEVDMEGMNTNEKLDFVIGLFRCLSNELIRSKNKLEVIKS